MDEQIRLTTKFSGTQIPARLARIEQQQLEVTSFHQRKHIKNHTQQQDSAGIKFHHAWQELNNKHNVRHFPSKWTYIL